ncbi:MAG TPA: hypothetical protein VG051_04855 [Candidatus Acidoferrum sp.]|jgi:hypothetical protein|nr:hypothetical protein [Candidatus Acidoferrum sp.]
MATPAEKVRGFTGLELRRSTRIQRAVRLMIVGQNRQGQPYREKMSTVSLNLHGCCYQSWHNSHLGAKIDLQVTEGFEAKSPVVRARVRSVRSPMSHSELYLIGVEFDTPANIWGIGSPPEDWLRVLEGTTTTTELATAAAPAPEPGEVPEESAAAPALPEMRMPAEPEWRHSGVTEFPAPPPPAATAQAEPAKEEGRAKLERVTITMDQLIAALHGKLQRAAEKAVQAALQVQLEETVKSSVQAAVTTHLDEAVRQALCKIDEISSANVRQAEAFSTQRLEDLTRASREEIFNHVEARVGELQGRWQDQQESYRSRAEEIIQRLEKLGEDTQRDLAETHQLVEKLSRAPGPQTHPLLEQSIGRAAEEFEASAMRVSDRQLVRLIEDKQMVTREASAQLEACAAEARAALQHAANGTLDEFRRQVEVQVDLAISEAGQRVSSSLASLEAENRAACEARRRSLENDVAQATQQATEQFRSGIKAFLYASLVAAVGAVDEHAQTTLAGLVKDQGLVRDQGKAAREIGGRADSAENAENRGESGGSGL